MRRSSRIRLLIGCLLFVFNGCSSAKTAESPAEASLQDLDPPIDLPASETDLPVSSFEEIWGYVVSGREVSFKSAYPISDVGYFGAELNSYGELVTVPDPKKLAPFSGRIHLVVGCGGPALSHFALMEGTQVRQRLIAALLEAAKDFDGLQIDFESIPERDGPAFHSFLAELRKGLGTKLFTVALRARTRTLANDVYDYGKIKPLVDRILVMAYDEHWSTSAPGPIASMNWCRSVAAYALKIIGPEKLIMGLPLYGRAWVNRIHNRAYTYTDLEALKKEQGVTEIRRELGIPTFTYETPLTVTVYYEDNYSLSARMELYRTMGVRSIGFWRVGQESPSFWSLLNLVPP
ncbi:MAG: glycoside hydrolase [Treponema sp.]|nr:glycoside hydrolase [Treponema sp.]